MKSIEGKKTTLQFIQENVIYDSIGDYTKLTHLKSGTTADYGRPELPLFSSLIQIKSDKEYSVDYKVLSSHVISDIKIFPFQNKDKTEEIGVINFSDTAFYNNDDVYPKNMLEVSERLIMRDLNLLNISVIPYRYNPYQNTLEIIDEIEIYVTESGERIDEGFGQRLPSQIFDNLYSTLIVNYDDTRNTQFQNPSILYICGGNSVNHPSFQQLIEWRHQRGYVVYTASLSQTGTSSSAIKNYIQNAYYNFDPPPEYIAFVGDVGGTYSVPTFYESWGHNDYGGQCEGDHPYSQLDGNDLFPEVLIGRISVRSSSELSIVVNKIIHYEKGTYASSMLPYFEKAALAGDPSTASGYSTAITNEYIAEMMESYDMEDVRLKISGGGWSSWMENQLNEGVLYFNYRGIYGVSGFSSGNIDNANNGFKLPLATIITCGTGSFSQHTTSLSEKFLRAGSISNPKGGIAGIATATLNTHTLFNNIINMGIYDGIFAKNIETVGGSLAHGKLTLFNAYPTNPYNWVNAFTQWNNLMGDPATHLWTDTPEELIVQYENEISFGTNYLDVNVSFSNGSELENAMVTLLKNDDEIFLNGKTNQNGDLTFNLNYSNDGEVNITVTKQNVIPFIGTFEISSEGKAVNINPTQEIIIDDGDEGNGNLNPGELIDIYIPLKNFGSMTAYGVQATLETSSSNVFILDENAYYGHLNSGAWLIGDGFTIQLDPSTINNENLDVKIHITDSSGEEWIGLVPLQVYGSELTVGNEGYIEKNETSDIQIEINNSGSVSIENIMGELSYNGNIIQILDSEGYWGTINSNESVVCLDCFTVTTSNTVVNGMISSLTLRLYNSEGFDIHKTFNLQIGELTESDPMGPDNYGYFIYDLADTSYNISIEYDWFEIDPDYGGPGTDLNISDSGNGIFSNSSELVELPFTFRFYGQDYENITVNANGWISMGETNMESFRNYPIPGAGGPSPMIAAFWDDLKTAYSGDVIYYIEPDNQFVIIEWSDMRTHNQNSLESFQVILYDSHAHPHGDGNIFIQYKTFNNTSSGNYAGGTPIHGGYSTIGIENHLGNDGLQYTFNNNYATAATELENNSTLLITTSLFQEPTANFDFELENSSVFFTDLSSVGNFIHLVEWNWNFGDGNFSIESSPTYYYSTPGTYEVSLTVTSHSGLVSTPSTAEIIIESCTDDIDACGVCGGSNIYLDCNGQCGEWTPICTNENYEGYIGPSACDNYIGIGSDYIYSDNSGFDYCGVCEGDNSLCTGCTDSEADNFNPENIFEDESCTYVFYGPGFAINFDGEDDLISIDEYNLGGVFQNTSDSFTFSAWIHPEFSGMERNPIITYSEFNGNKNFELSVNSDGNIEIFIQNPCGENDLIIGNGEIQFNDWNFIALTYSSDILTALLNDNVYVDTTCGEEFILLDNANLILGKSTTDNNYFKGTMDEIRIWDFSRGIDEISEQMYDGVDSESDGLVAYWRMDEENGDKTFDATSSNNDGLLIGSPERVESSVPFIMPPFITLIASADTLSWPVDLKIGMFTEATDEYDFWVDRYAPPPPPSSTWDAAIFNPIVNDRFFIDIRSIPENDEITEWAIDFQPDIGTDEITLSWNPDELVEGNFILSDPFDGVIFSVNMHEIHQYSFPPEFTRVIIKFSINTGTTVTYLAGWNLIGLPLAVLNPSYEFLFPGAIEGTLFSFLNGYVPQANLLLGNGYWLRFAINDTTTITGLDINEVTLNLQEGWNLISGITDPVTVSSISDSNSIIVPNTFYGFNESYEEADVINPGKGYWVRAFQEGNVFLSSDTTVSIRYTENEVDILTKINSLSINNMTLYFGGELPAKEKLSFSLPPKPPVGAFDARFQGDWKYTEEKGEIDIMSLGHLLTISYEIKIDEEKNKNWVLISDSGEKYVLNNSGVITIPSSNKLYLIKELKTPHSFTLHKNFPNPFNPTTTITYDLPEDIFVELIIFDMLGRKISNIVNEQQKAGFKSVQWDGTDSMGSPVSSGIYLFQIRAGNFIRTKKMVLLK